MRVSVLLAVVAASLALCGGAEAATVTVGSPLTVEFSGSAIGGELTYLNRTLAEPGQTRPRRKTGPSSAGGWSASISGGPFRLVVLRPVGGEKYEAVAAGELETPPDGSEALDLRDVAPDPGRRHIGLNVPVGGSTTVGEADRPHRKRIPNLLSGTSSPETRPRPRRRLAKPRSGSTPTSNTRTPVVGPPPPTVPPAAHCVVPNLSGKKLKSAKKMLTKADCKLGKVRRRAAQPRRRARSGSRARKPGKSLRRGRRWLSP